MNWHIAALGAQDALRYRDLMVEAYTLAADAFTSTPEERAAAPESWWARRIADPAGLAVAWGAFFGAQLVGSVAMEYYSKPKTAHKGHVIGMYLQPAFRGRGIAQGLLEAAIGHASQRPGIQVLTLTVTEGNEAAIRLYLQAGFVVFGTEPMAILTPGGFKGKVHMWRPLTSGHAAAPSA